jgi:hypothetical protein
MRRKVRSLVPPFPQPLFSCDIPLRLSLSSGTGDSSEATGPTRWGRYAGSCTHQQDRATQQAACPHVCFLASPPPLPVHPPPTLLYVLPSPKLSLLGEVDVTDARLHGAPPYRENMQQEQDGDASGEHAAKTRKRKTGHRTRPL